MRFLLALVTATALVSFTWLRAQEAAPTTSRADDAQQASLTTEMRRKLTDGRDQISADPQYQALVKAARQAQELADDYFMAKLQKVVANDGKLARYVAEMIKQQKALRASAPSAGGTQ